MAAIVIIPARYGSTRFPGKPLCHLLGKPLIQHVYERVIEARLVRDVFIATDSTAIYSAVVGFGGKAVMTSTEHRSGTDRIAEAVTKLTEANDIGGAGERGEQIIVNVQGDEPLIRPEMVDALIGLMEDERAAIGTLAKRIQTPEEIEDPNVVKVVFNDEGFALYFSRSPIPYHRDLDYVPGSPAPRFPDSLFYKHIGIYAYRKEALLRFSRLAPSRLEEIEKLEQLRALEGGFKIKVHETRHETIGVDTAMDLERVEKCLSLSL
ncbi:MAG TPA: 3-deoxy-manno-octulosonate cytidylyltransferase [Dissulfurispiraceae bacterium]|nr:3-deoxy-manno-octulosonate cytidylyltransferase [Dissulfurispiraceae bacterium]